MLSEEKKQKEEKILAFVEEKTYRPMKIKEMAVLFSVPKKERGQFHEVLDSLILQGKIEIDRRGLIRLAREKIRTGIFMATRRGFGFVRLEEEKEDIFIPENCCKNAFDGDTVQIRLTGDGSKRKGHKEGEILNILERSCQRLVGTFTRNRKVTFVIPDRDKFTKDIYIPPENTLDAVEGHKVVVELLDYGSETKNPKGQIIQILGHVNDPGVDVLSVIKSFDLPEEFPEEVLRQISGIGSRIDFSEIGARTDLRSLDTVTIDGEDAKDLDDAITIEKKEDGTYELGVHIADVSHYVTENSPLDREARKRGTSVYLTDRVIPMLPHKLSNGICSLNAGEDRFALSCIMQFDAGGKIIQHRIEETLIQVTERMNYSDVNDILTCHNEQTRLRYRKLIPMFETMKELAGILRRERKKQGSINFDFPECKIKLDHNGHPVDIAPYERNVATNIIEEFMLAANKVVAEEYFWLDLPFIYRTHEYPDLEKVQKLAKMTAGFGYHMKVGREEVHPKEIQKLIEQIEGSQEEAFLSRLILRAMKRAGYSTVNEGHFGLASRYYCHFTSPIRRYPDLQIHRIIKENIHRGIREGRLQHYAAILPEVAKSSSDLERRADEAEREVEKMKKAEYMQDYIGESFEGIVSGVTSWGIYVELPNTVEGMVRLSDMRDDYYEFEEEKYRVLGHYSGQEYRMGQKVKVKVSGVNPLSKTIDFEMLQRLED